ncbi:hypothetical protein [Mycobacterium colombiense]|uniref:hypothetical protein n=1 Tax=Mycobacterium colombiense TaxID=339268 RepID=UPI0020A2B485|nr:hypothetical protein [Mycobacterium colombiense]
MAALASNDSVIDAQRRILECLRQETVSDGIYKDRPVSVLQFLADVAAVGGRVLNYSQCGDLRARISPDLLQRYRDLSAAARNRRGKFLVQNATSVSAAIETVMALGVLDSSDLAIAGLRLRPLVTSSRSQGKAVTASNIGWGKYVSEALRGAQLSALEPFLGPSDHLRYRCGSALPRRPQRTPGRHHHVPALLWPQLACRFTISGIGSEQLASALAAAVVVVGTPTTLGEACSLLGSITSAASVSRVLQALRNNDHLWCDVGTVLGAVADTLDAGACPIDYHRRRSIPFAKFLTDDNWRDICCDTATPVGRTIKLRLVRSWMYQQLTGSPARLSFDPVSRGYRFKLANLVRSLTPELVTRLEMAAREFLIGQGCGDEPLRWYPSQQVIDDCACAVPWRPVVDIARLHRLARDPELSLTAVADQLNLAVVDVLNILEAHPAPDVISRDHCRGGSFAEAKMQLSRSTLVDLYVGQRLGLARIGAYAGVSRQTVTRLARHYGIALRTPGRPPFTQ